MFLILLRLLRRFLWAIISPLWARWNHDDPILQFASYVRAGHLYYETTVWVRGPGSVGLEKEARGTKGTVVGDVESASLQPHQNYHPSTRSGVLRPLKKAKTSDTPTGKRRWSYRCNRLPRCISTNDLRDPARQAARHKGAVISRFSVIRSERILTRNLEEGYHYSVNH
ncbi:hypothetical protein EAI_02556 [Harpegnathos saltator]|uniref:Secreted protein n=1 Tax=Harpegnathos saltator TaxID=610380 RepID=E2B753_HARSA|nr:hypothetical protein EAI_02556 [Harpegnathos saltator]